MKADQEREDKNCFASKLEGRRKIEKTEFRYVNAVENDLREPNMKRRR